MFINKKKRLLKRFDQGRADTLAMLEKLDKTSQGDDLKAMFAKAFLPQLLIYKDDIFTDENRAEFARVSPKYAELKYVTHVIEDHITTLGKMKAEFDKTFT